MTAANKMSFEEWVQSRLAAHGFPAGRIDGIWGKNTIAALKAFQRCAGLPATGAGDVATVAALRQSASALPPDAAVDRALLEADAAKAAAAFPSPWPRQRDVPGFYGAVGTQQASLELPFPMVLAWDLRRKVSKITVHRKVHDSAGRAFAAIAATYGAKDRRALGLDIFGGSLNVRRMRGGSAYSMHSWGIAIDFDPARNALKANAKTARLARSDCLPFWQAWEAEGWLSLGRARDFDWMHVQAARL